MFNKIDINKIISESDHDVDKLHVNLDAAIEVKRTWAFQFFDFFGCASLFW
jgi:uncharacterized protein YdaL